MAINYVDIFMLNPEEYLNQYSSNSNKSFEVKSTCIVEDNNEKRMIIKDSEGEITFFTINQENCKKVLERYNSITTEKRYEIISKIAIANAEYDLAVEERKKAHSIMNNPIMLIKFAESIKQFRLDIHEDILKFIRIFHTDQGCYFIPDNQVFLNIQTKHKNRIARIYDCNLYRMSTSDFDDSLVVLFNTYIAEHDIQPHQSYSKIYNSNVYFINFEKMLAYCNLHTY